MLVVTVINFNAYPFLELSEPTSPLEDTEIGTFWFCCAFLIVSRPNLEEATTRPPSLSVVILFLRKSTQYM